MEKYSRLKPQGIVVVFVFNVPPTAKVIWRRATASSLIRQTGTQGIES